MSELTEHREVERKFRVHALFRQPDLVAAGVLSGVTTLEPFDMTAVYHDTDSLALFRWGITLRRREGGADEGWHLKLPVPGGQARDEMRMPLAAGAIGTVPAALADVVSPLVRGQRLNPQVTIRTHRAPTMLLDSGGRSLLELVDDSVSVLDAEGRAVTVFRELEVEVIDPEDQAAHALLAKVVDALLAEGAEPGSASKAASALGPRAAEPADVAPLPLPSEGGFAADALRSAISTHVRHLLLADVAVRRDQPDAVHQMRVAARRLRSVLRAFAPLVDETWAAGLREELSWVAAELGAIRDIEVLKRRLDDDADLLGEPDATAARALIDARLEQRLVAGRSGAIAALRSDRHEWLIDDLVDAARSPRLLDDAFQPYEEVLPDLVTKAWRRLVKAQRGLRIDGPAEEWHAARITAKRARYTVEAVAGIFGRRAADLADELSDVTEVLGEHQDACVAQIVLRELAAGADGPTAFALGRLHDIESEREMLARFAFLDLWPDTKRAARRSGLVRRGR